MSFRTTRARRAGSFQFEALEDRSLLNAAIPASPTAQIQTLKKTALPQHIQGPLSGTFSETNHLVSLSGKGSLLVLGETNLTGQYKTSLNLKTLKLTITGGTATLASGANTINVKYTGSGKYANGLITSTMKGSITGGSGAFKGATGSFSASGTAEAFAGKFTVNVNATVKPKV